ncbi:MAG TPA: hypothetical protein VF646_19185, partial [Cytophagales bacterium]
MVIFLAWLSGEVRQAGQRHVALVRAAVHQHPGSVQFRVFVNPVEQLADVLHGFFPLGAVVEGNLRFA